MVLFPAGGCLILLLLAAQERPFPDQPMGPDLGAALAGGDSARQQAALTRLELELRGRHPGTENPGRYLGAVLALTKPTADPTVRRAAVRTLILLPAKPADVSQALSALLAAAEVADRRAAAAALAGWPAAARDRLLHAPPDPQDNQPGELGVVPVFQALIPLAGKALGDADAEIQTHALGTVRAVADHLRDLVSHDLPRAGIPGQDAGPPLGERLKPTAEALAKVVPGVARLADGPTLRPALEALEVLADASGYLYPTPFPGAPPPAPVASPFRATLRPALRSAVATVAQRAGAGEVRDRLAALYALEALDEDAAPAVATLTAAGKAENAYVRWAAARALGRMAPQGAKDAVPALTALLTDTAGDVRLSAAAGLARFGAAARGAVPALAKAAQAADAETRWQAVKALAAVGGPEAVAPVRAALGDAEWVVRARAAQLLPSLGPLDAASRAALLKATDDPAAQVRDAASRALLEAPTGP